MLAYGVDGYSGSLACDLRAPQDAEAVVSVFISKGVRAFCTVLHGESKRKVDAELAALCKRDKARRGLS